MPWYRTSRSAEVFVTVPPPAQVVHFVRRAVTSPGCGGRAASSYRRSVMPGPVVRCGRRCSAVRAAPCGVVRCVPVSVRVRVPRFADSVGSVGTLNPGSPEGCFITICGGLLQYPVGGVRCLTPRPAQWKCVSPFENTRSHGCRSAIEVISASSCRTTTTSLLLLSA